MVGASNFPYFQKPEEPPKAEELGLATRTGCPFLKLPYELRSHIYSYVLPSTTDYPDRGIVWIRATAAIWATNRQVYNECTTLLYGNNTFLIDIRYDKVGLLYQWILPQTPLIPKRIFNFADSIAPRNKALMRKFHVRVHQIDSYMIAKVHNDLGWLQSQQSGVFFVGMAKLVDTINSEYLARGLRCQVSTFCDFLKELHEIRELRISYHGGSEENYAFLQLVMEPFWHLENTRTVNVRDPERVDEVLATRLQEHLTDAYTKKSLLRLPLELREDVYPHALPHTLNKGTGDSKVIG